MCIRDSLILAARQPGRITAIANESNYSAIGETALSVRMRFELPFAVFVTEEPGQCGVRYDLSRRTNPTQWVAVLDGCSALILRRCTDHTPSREDQNLIELGDVVTQHILDPLELGRLISVLTKPQIHDASMGLPMRHGRSRGPPARPLL